MKRSFAVDLIADFLFKTNDEYGFKRLAKKDAEVLLSLLEKEGLQPPAYLKQISPIDRYDVNEWEPEDEAS